MNIVAFLLSLIFIRIEVLSLKATFSGGYGTGSSSLYGTGLIADG
jgi:hypothetical protein